MNNNMAHAIVGVCTLEVYLPYSHSLKAKRSVLKSMFHRLRQKFNISVAEVDHQDVWQSATIGFALVTNSTRHANQMLNTVIAWLEQNFPDVLITKQEFEFL
jgi:uncharacterized protein YlxP (DUF503 family)